MCNMEDRSESSSPAASLSLPDHYVKELIEKYEASPTLWDPAHLDYSNKVRRALEMKKLVGVYRNIKPDATVADVRRKINSLRSNYRREVRKIEQSERTASTPEDVYQPKNLTFSLLRFLDRVEDSEDGHNISEEKYLVDEKSQSEPEVVVSDKSYSDDEPRPRKIPHRNKTRLKKKKRKGDVPPVKNRSHTSNEIRPENNRVMQVIAEQNELINRACTLLAQPGPPPAAPSRAALAVSPLALVWSDKLDKLPPKQRLYAEKAINDILFEAELNNLNRNSVIINKPASVSPPPSSPRSPSPPLPANARFT